MNVEITLRILVLEMRINGFYELSGENILSKLLKIQINKRKTMQPERIFKCVLHVILQTFI